MDQPLQTLVTLVTLFSGVLALYLNYTKNARSDLAEDYARIREELRDLQQQKELWEYEKTKSNQTIATLYMRLSTYEDDSRVMRAVGRTRRKSPNPNPGEGDEPER